MIAAASAMMKILTLADKSVPDPKLIEARLERFTTC